MVPVSAALGWAVLTGLGLGLGLWLLASTVPRIGRPRLIDRVAPYVLDVSEGARQRLARRTADPLPLFGLVLAPVIGPTRRLLASALGGTATIETRLRQSGSLLSVDAYRSSQLVWLVCGAILGVVLAVAAGRLQPVGLPMAVAVTLVTAGLGLLARDLVLKRAAAKRVARIESELPTMLEFLTLSLSAGEGILDALRRVSRVSRGEIAAEFARVVAEVNAGVPLADSLHALARSLRVPAFSRVVEQLTGALERGTPLVDVLRAQAQDSRDDAKRQLLEVAGKKEVAMLVPVVFLILPITVAFAIFPGIAVLQLGF
ncbi:type II secretion system F family protein [Salinibacterium sp. ZJ450]|uniref:type II secretion system F family protein n=1 Tax=Salinibacterium sp. ZJ450 TaxID=2708338 RepID=UPI001CD65E8E|nr:type II secretion system F family protein [Salinibacterium sp. ZJ450]